MAYAVKRAVGYAGYYRDAHGKRISAGIFPTKEEAVIRARDLEGLPPVERAQASGTVPCAGTYVEHFERWLIDVKSLGGLAPRSWIGYEGHIRRNVLPLIGHREVASLNQKVIRDMFEVMTRNGVGPHTMSQCKNALGRSLRDLVPSVLTSNPTHGVKIAKPPTTPFALLTPEDFAKVWAVLTEPQALFAAVLISTGARFGEGSELRVKDIDFRTSELSVRRRVTIVNGALGDGSRFAVLHGTKKGRSYSRTIGLPSTLAESLRRWIDSNDFQPNDLLFPSRLISWRKTAVDHETIRGKAFDVSGVAVFHGTAYGYAGGKCRCDECGAAWRSYKGQDRSKINFRGCKRGSDNLTGHLSPETWRTIWYSACEASGIGWRPRVHDLRHAYATHLVGAGVSLHEVQVLMGHGSIETTMKYLHRVEAMRSKAVEVAGAFTQKRSNAASIEVASIG